MSRVGRPTSIIELNLNKIDQTVQNIISLCSNHIVKSKVLQLCAALKTNLVTVTTISTQSDFERSLSETGTQTSTHFNETGSQTSTHFNADTILNDIERHGLSNEDIEYLYENLFQNLQEVFINWTKIFKKSS